MGKNSISKKEQKESNLTLQQWTWIINFPFYLLLDFYRDSGIAKQFIFRKRKYSLRQTGWTSYFFFPKEKTQNFKLFLKNRYDFVFNLYFFDTIFCVCLYFRGYSNIFFSFPHSFVRHWSLSGPAISYGAALGPHGMSEYSLASDSAVEGSELFFGTKGLHSCARSAELPQQE